MIMLRLGAVTLQYIAVFLVRVRILRVVFEPLGVERR